MLVTKTTILIAKIRVIITNYTYMNKTDNWQRAIFINIAIAKLVKIKKYCVI